MTRAKPIKLPIFLNGQDTGLSAWSRNEAVDSMHRVLQRRGRFNVTRQMLIDGYQTSKGRVDFNLEAEAKP